METHVETIIVGAGISGLACANKLHNAHKEFIIISKDIGGRIKFSKKDPKIALGGIYINSDYFNLMPFVEIIEPFRVRDFYFFNGKNYKTVCSLKNLKYFPKIIRFMGLLWRFRNQLNAMRKDAENKELRFLIEKNPLLKKYWHLSAAEFLRKNGFEELDYWFGQPTAGTNFFTTSKDMNTFYYMYLFLTMIRPSYIVDLSKTTDKLSKGFESKIFIDTVLLIEKQEKGNYLVLTEKERFIAENVVIAAPYLDIMSAYDVPKPSKISSVFTYYVSGQRKEAYANKKGVVLRPDFHDAYLLWEQKYGGDLIYAKTGDLDLNKYYKDFIVQDKILWKTAGHIPDGSRFIKQELDMGLYLASDYNFSLMEDAFITGIYAANQIINKQ
ncbi:MAG: NAD(P)-binding protein [Patescibacteria group bacterium]